jgi:Fe-S cluster assembly iron-binding protein IscA
MSDRAILEMIKEYQKSEQRFEATLRIYLQRGGGSYTTQLANMQDAIEEADALLDELEGRDE